MSEDTLHICCISCLLRSQNHTLRLTRELEKKFSDRHVVFVGQRRILPKEPHGRRLGQKRPFSRTLTAVHERILEDLVYPTDIVGKRVRVGVDGSKLLKVCVYFTNLLASVLN